ncbi:hypothetical protein QF031_002238 [Pseudarthrobacter defluvii]|uniref:hypothetical protein n=1 Tax=Pseudarthrobacter defluvii TaxID=410837 RepID=UPI002786742B|nr:hypothetical protein [Pseudarthrobacter defluvii]MDQ0769489.1 hypothetical protein [Pseudarthrobacter defluvii]
MLHLENISFPTTFSRAVGRLIMNMFGPADRSPVDTPIIHKNDDEEAASQEQLADIEIEHDNEGHVWAEQKTHLKE